MLVGLSNDDDWEPPRGSTTTTATTSQSRRSARKCRRKRVWGSEAVGAGPSSAKKNKSVMPKVSDAFRARDRLVAKEEEALGPLGDKETSKFNKLKSEYHKNADKYDAVTVTIAVVGEAGLGKTTLVNELVSPLPLLAKVEKYKVEEYEVSDIIAALEGEDQTLEELYKLGTGQVGKWPLNAGAGATSVSKLVTVLKYREGYNFRLECWDGNTLLDSHDVMRAEYYLLPKVLVEWSAEYGAPDGQDAEKRIFVFGPWATGPKVHVVDIPGFMTAADDNMAASAVKDVDVVILASKRGASEASIDKVVNMLMAHSKDPFCAPVFVNYFDAMGSAPGEAIERQALDQFVHHIRDKVTDDAITTTAYAADVVAYRQALADKAMVMPNTALVLYDHTMAGLKHKGFGQLDMATYNAMIQQRKWLNEFFTRPKVYQKYVTEMLTVAASRIVGDAMRPAISYLIGIMSLHNFECGRRQTSIQLSHDGQKEADAAFLNAEVSDADWAVLVVEKLHDDMAKALSAGNATMLVTRIECVLAHYIITSFQKTRQAIKSMTRRVIAGKKDTPRDKSSKAQFEATCGAIEKTLERDLERLNVTLALDTNVAHEVTDVLATWTTSVEAMARLKSIVKSAIEAYVAPLRNNLIKFVERSHLPLADACEAAADINADKHAKPWKSLRSIDERFAADASAVMNKFATERDAPGGARHIVSAAVTSMAVAMTRQAKSTAPRPVPKLKVKVKIDASAEFLITTLEYGKNAERVATRCKLRVTTPTVGEFERLAERITLDSTPIVVAVSDTSEAPLLAKHAIVFLAPNADALQGVKSLIATNAKTQLLLDDAFFAVSGQATAHDAEALAAFLAACAVDEWTSESLGQSVVLPSRTTAFGALIDLGLSHIAQARDSRLGTERISLLAFLKNVKRLEAAILCEARKAGSAAIRSDGLLIHIIQNKAAFAENTTAHVKDPRYILSLDELEGIAHAIADCDELAPEYADIMIGVNRARSVSAMGLAYAVRGAAGVSKNDVLIRGKLNSGITLFHGLNTLTVVPTCSTASSRSGNAGKETRSRRAKLISAANEKLAAQALELQWWTTFCHNDRPDRSSDTSDTHHGAAAPTTVPMTKAVRVRGKRYSWTVFDGETETTTVYYGPGTVPLSDSAGGESDDRFWPMTDAPVAHIQVPHGHYLLISNPVVMDVAGRPMRSSDGKMYALEEGKVAVIVAGSERTRLGGVVLYPGETLLTETAKPLRSLPAHAALHVRMIADGADPFDGFERSAGDEFVVVGPRSDVRSEDDYYNLVISVVSGAVSVVGVEELLAAADGSGQVFPPLASTVLSWVTPIDIARDAVVHLRAVVAGKDATGVVRRAGEVFAVGRDDLGSGAVAYVPYHGEELVRVVCKLELEANEWCIVANPMGESGVRLGARELRRGPTSFFLQPGEELVDPPGVAMTYTIDYGEALVLEATEPYEPHAGEEAHPVGEVWLAHGPLVDYIPPLGVQVQEVHRAIDVSASEAGIYVATAKTGTIRRITAERLGSPFYTLSADEELAERDDVGATPYTTARSTRWEAVCLHLPEGVAVGVRNVGTQAVRVELGPVTLALEYEEELVRVALPTAADDGRGAQTSCETYHVSSELGPLLGGGAALMGEWMPMTTAEGCRVFIHLVFGYSVVVDAASRDALLGLFAEPEWAASLRRQLCGTVRPLLRPLEFRKVVFDGEELIRAALGPFPSTFAVVPGVCVTSVAISTFLGQDGESTLALNTLLEARAELDSAQRVACDLEAEREAQREHARQALRALESQIAATREELDEEIVAARAPVVWDHQRSSAVIGMLGGGGVDGAIHRAAGLELREECEQLDGCEPGDAKITHGYKLAARHVIHTVGPIVWTELCREDAFELVSCYLSSLELAKAHGLTSIAFCCIATGVYGFPNEPAARFAVRAVREWMDASPENATAFDRIVFCVFMANDKALYEDALLTYFPRVDTAPNLVPDAKPKAGLPDAPASSSSSSSSSSSASEEKLCFEPDADASPETNEDVDGAVPDGADVMDTDMGALQTVVTPGGKAVPVGPSSPPPPPPPPAAKSTSAAKTPPPPPFDPSQAGQKCKPVLKRVPPPPGFSSWKKFINRVIKPDAEVCKAKRKNVRRTGKQSECVVQ
ncbi:uncharacterized protein AMSG_12143 [Thecamonas trahens ATCC 50062]|uniref:Macro domain-containing protein n=1 Tax=Thecamonas trahens ATCC 50062 TaxID=461836 RepID=A0A0L0DKR5_THETB|nr:hypothetical protein AMSG_12143 [Thecamonas trahens ATCC 50062]KNC51948.1 hypothetical protein AMSG_12143 [Thecamonas trahens ATCC 50062]|eukprot:XP_013755628.1 hypothetical protein AMSG_12143 [Thecamonas trahens ATCC 50062]